MFKGILENPWRNLKILQQELVDELGSTMLTFGLF